MVRVQLGNTENHPARSSTLSAKPMIGRLHSVLEAARTEPPPFTASASWTLYPVPTIFLCLPPESLVGTLELSIMGTPNDQAVLQAILNPNTPFGDVVGLDLEETEEGDEGKSLTLVSTPL